MNITQPGDSPTRRRQAPPVRVGILSLYEKSEALAASRGATVEQFIVEAVKKEVHDTIRSGASYGDREVDLPVIRSMRPGTLDLSNFDFDDLLARRQPLDLDVSERRPLVEPGQAGKGVT
jgi:hypothetical protein